MVVDDPVSVLLEERDPIRRSRAHRVLGQRAYERRDLEIASDHLREAVDLDPTDEEPKVLLARIAQERPARRRWLGWF
jgi:hypothetical protein